MAVDKLFLATLNNPYASKACDASSVISEKLILNTSIALPYRSATYTHLTPFLIGSAVNLINKSIWVRIR